MTPEEEAAWERNPLQPQGASMSLLERIERGDDYRKLDRRIERDRIKAAEGKLDAGLT